MPLRNKPTLFHRDTHAINSDHQWTFLLVILIPNTVVAITRAIHRNDFSLAFLCVSVCVCLFLLHLCVSKYVSLPKNDNWRRKFWLKVNMWLLYTAVSFGYVYQFVDFFIPQVTVILYCVVSLCSLFLFYVFVVVDLVKYWKIWRCDEDDHRLLENRRFDAGKLKCYSVSIWEKV